jgi:FkbM family methyltransferase
MKKNELITIYELIKVLPEIRRNHSPDTEIYKLLSRLSQSIFESSIFRTKEIKSSEIGGFGDVIFPYIELGSVSSLDVFSSLNELIIFSYYLQNRKKYKKVIDIGANIGLHTILMAKLGWHIVAYEPDPLHLSILKNNISHNKLRNVKVVESAVSNKNGKSSFVRVMGNTTSSHIAGAKDKPYGDLETIDVVLVNIDEILSDVDLIKIDAEGHEAEIICGIPEDIFINLDIMVEVGSESNASRIFEYCMEIGMNLFSQKIGWNLVKDFKEVPMHYKEGSLFITPSKTMSWS